MDRSEKTLQNTIHLHLVDITAGWSTTLSLCPMQFHDALGTTIYLDEDKPLDDLTAIQDACENLIRNSARSNLQVLQGESALLAIFLFASYLEQHRQLCEEPLEPLLEPGDRILAVGVPPKDLRDDALLLTDFIPREDFVALNGPALSHAVLNLLAKTLPHEGWTTTNLDIHPRWEQSLEQDLSNRSKAH